MRYCVYCNLEHDESVFTDEHVIPFAIGGSDSLVIRTCARENNDLDRDVDAPFIDLFTIRSKRFFLGLESTKGNPPSLDLSGVTWIDGKETPISYLIRDSDKDLRITRPSVERTSVNGQETWQVSGDPAQVRKILEGKIRKQSALGKTVTLADGSILKVEDLDRVFEDRKVVLQSPSILRQITIDLLVPIRFFSKVALALGFFRFGEEFGRSSVGSLLRSHMRLAKLEDTRIKGAIWPTTEPISRMLELIGAEDEHTLVIMENSRPAFLANLFGDHGALIAFDGFVTNTAPRADNGTAWRIQLPSRRLIESTLVDLVAHRADKKSQEA